MRLIDATKLRETMYHEAFETDSDMQKWDSGCWIRYKMFENNLDNAPTVDAVPVVRCKGCEHYDAEYRRCFGSIGYGRYWKPDDFCSYGEPKKGSRHGQRN